MLIAAWTEQLLGRQASISSSSFQNRHGRPGWRSQVEPSLRGRGERVTRLALGAAPPARASAPAAERALRLATFRPMRRVAVGTLRMTLLAGVAVLAVLAPIIGFGVTPIGLGPRPLRSLLNRSRRRLEALEGFGRGREIGGKRRNRDLLPGGPLDI